MCRPVPYGPDNRITGRSEKVVSDEYVHYDRDGNLTGRSIGAPIDSYVHYEYGPENEDAHF